MTTLIETPPTTSAVDARWLGQAGQAFLRWSRNTLREPWGAGLSLLQPVIWILLFGQVFSALGKLPGLTGSSYLNFLVPGVLMMTVLYSGAWAGTGYIEDMKTGVMNQLLTAPVSRSALVAGQLAQQSVVMVAQSAVVLLIGFAGGARYPGGVGGIALTLFAALLLAVIFCGFSAAVALTTGSQIALIGLAQIVVLPAVFLSQSMMATELLPVWVRHVAEYNPVSWAVQIGRDALAGRYPWSTIGWHSALLAILGAACFGWAVSSFRSYQRSQ